MSIGRRHPFHVIAGLSRIFAYATTQAKGSRDSCEDFPPYVVASITPSKQRGLRGHPKLLQRTMNLGLNKTLSSQVQCESTEETAIVCIEPVEPCRLGGHGRLEKASTHPIKLSVSGFHRHSGLPQPVNPPSPAFC